jgi:5'-nucleotidase
LRPIVDLVAVTSHASYHDDLEYIPRTEGIDIVFGGHLHIALDPPNVIQDCDISRLKRERDRYICDTPEKLKAAQDLCRDKTCISKPDNEKAACETECVQGSILACEREMATRRYAQRLEELDGDIAFLEQRGCHPRNVLLVHSGAFLKYIGRLQVTLRQCHRLEDKTICIERDARGNCVHRVNRRCLGNASGTNDWEVIAHDYHLMPVDRNLPHDPQMLQLLEPFTLELSQQQLLTQVLGYTPRRLFRFSKGTGDSEMGNLLTEAMATRNQVWADFAISNSLGIRSDIVSGPVTNEQMTNVFPFDNTITVLYLSGYEVQEMMDFVAQRSASRGCQSQAQVSGLTATLNCGGCPGDGGNTCIRENYDGEACAQRVTIGGSGRACDPSKEDADCATDGSGKPTGEICTTQRHPDSAQGAQGKTGRCWLPISCTRSYRVASNDYIAHGGSGFTVLGRNTTQEDLEIPLREAAKDFIIQMPACARIPPTFKEKTSNPPAQPRFVLDDSKMERLQNMEARALSGNVDAAEQEYAALVQELVHRQQDLDTLITDETDAYKQELLINERRGIKNYLGCVDEQPDNDGRCLGLACSQIKACDDYSHLQGCCRSSPHRSRLPRLGDVRC